MGLKARVGGIATRKLLLARAYRLGAYVDVPPCAFIIPRFFLFACSHVAAHSTGERPDEKY